MALTVQDVELGRHYPFGFADGAKPGFKCSVTLQIGDKSYDKVSVELPVEATKAIIAAIVAEAMKLMTVDIDAIDVVGAPGVPEPEIADAAEPMAEVA